MLAKLSLCEVLLDGLIADDTVPIARVRIFDDLRALVADLSELADLVEHRWILVAGQVHLIGQALLEIVAAESGIFVMDLAGHQTNPNIIIYKGVKCFIAKLYP